MSTVIRNEYFEWLYNLVCEDKFSPEISYRKLLMRLHNTDYNRFLIPNDKNRAKDGMDLRYRYAITHDQWISSEEIEEALRGRCSILEMMIALAIRCEENIMDDPGVGDRTAQWFWGMVVNLGLGSMSDERFDISIVDEAVRKFMYREYEPDGKGGLFRIRDCDEDLRDVEIWYQLCWYLDSIM